MATGCEPTFNLSDKPTLPMIIRMGIIQKIGAKCKSLGALLLNDDNGSKVALIEGSVSDMETITKNIISKWLEGSGVGPVTWATFVSEIKAVELNELARDIEGMAMNVARQPSTAENESATTIVECSTVSKTSGSSDILSNTAKITSGGSPVQSEQGNRTVVLDGEVYTLEKPPSGDSKIVVEMKKRLVGSINLGELVEDLSHVGRCVQLAYHGVVSAGPKYAHLQNKVYRLEIDVTKLCNESSVTISGFKNTASKTLVKLQATYMYLLEGFEDMAVHTLSAISKQAKEMGMKAKELHRRFSDEVKVVEGVLEETRQGKAEQALYKEEMQKKKMEFEELQKVQEVLVHKAKEKEKQANARLRELELQVDTASSDLGSDIFGSILGMFGYISPKQRRFEAVSKTRQEAQAMRLERENLRCKAMEKLTEFAVMVKSCTREEDFAQSSEDALHKAMEGLKLLAALMLQAAQFWEQLQQYCEGLASEDIKDQVDRVMKTGRRNVWTSEAFKIQAVNFYAGWVALESVCGEYMSAIKETQAELYKYIKENPTYEEAKQTVPMLAIKFEQDTKDAEARSNARRLDLQRALND